MIFLQLKRSESKPPPTLKCWIYKCSIFKVLYILLQFIETTTESFISMDWAGRFYMRKYRDEISSYGTFRWFIECYIYVLYSAILCNMHIVRSCKKKLQSVRETGVSCQNKGPLKPLNTTVLWSFEGLHGGASIGAPWCRETPVSHFWPLLYFPIRADIVNQRERDSRICQPELFFIRFLKYLLYPQYPHDIYRKFIYINIQHMDRKFI